jgi:hypothetical protein
MKAEVDAVMAQAQAQRAGATEIRHTRLKPAPFPEIQSCE